MLFSRFFTGLALSLLFSVNAAAEFPIAHQRDRILPLLTTIESYIVQAQQRPDFDSKTMVLNSETNRSSLQRLQNLMRLYAGKAKPGEEVKPKPYDMFLGYYELAKEFEDHISHLRDIRYFYDIAQREGTEAAKKKYQRLLDEEKASYKLFLEGSPWFVPGANGMTVIQELRAKIDAFQWPTLLEDRNFFLKKIAKRMKKIHKKVYDMNDVEEGMHELRRDVRRINYFNNAINNLVQGDFERECPLGAPVVKDPEPIGNGEYYCRVSECLMDTLYTAVIDLGTLKRQGGVYHSRGEPIPQRILEQAQQIHDQLKGSEVFMHMNSQLKECKTP